MRTTIDIPDAELEEVIRLTGARTKREAVVTAITEFNRRKRRETLAEKLGTFDAVITAEQLARLREAP
jgi:Arc/MetJ family transcription regulator